MELELKQVITSEPTQEEVETRGVLMSVLAGGNPFVFISAWIDEQDSEEELNLKLESSIPAEDNYVLKAILQAALDSLGE